MKVLMVNRVDSREFPGGDTVQMEQTKQALERLGVEVEVCLSTQLPDGNWKCDLVHIFNIQTAEESWRVCRLAKEHGLPVALSPIYWDPLPEWFTTAHQKRLIWRAVKRAFGERLGFPLYAVWQRWRYPSQPRWRLQRLLLESADGILPNSRVEVQQLVTDFRLGPKVRERIMVVPNAVDRRLFGAAPKPNPELRSRLGPQDIVLQVGRLAPEKNPLGLLLALREVPLTLLFVGSPSPHHPQYVARLHEEAHARGNVHLIERVAHEDLPGVYALAAVHALPSWRETPGLASLEAAAAGCRIVSTSLGSAREYLRDDAWYCHPANLGSIRRAVIAARKASPSNSLRNRILERYSWERAAEVTLAAYHSVMNRRQPELAGVGFDMGSS